MVAEALRLLLAALPHAGARLDALLAVLLALLIEVGGARALPAHLCQVLSGNIP